MTDEEETTSEGRTLLETPTWALATVCFLSIFISSLIEHLLHLLAQYFNKKRRRSLIQALDKIKSAETFLPCGTNDSDAYSDEETKCLEQEKVSFLSREGVKQLQFLIFILAFFHSLSSVLTFSLGMAKMKSWESWEAETRTLEYEFTYDPRRFLFTHQTSFGRRHLRFWSEHSFLRWPACFLQQFYKSVSRADYLTLRHGFIMKEAILTSKNISKELSKRTLKRSWESVPGFGYSQYYHILQCTRPKILARARKNLKTNHSLQPSLNTSPSYTLEASFSVYGDHPPPCDNTDYVAVEIGSEEKGSKGPVEH
ncbi:hypothetical protein Q3G72_029247 [Acer saccharum]|nr:hypothetical protein Q3G72_029247 [Acer saccharum]